MKKTPELAKDDTFRWDCIKGVRAIKDEIDSEIVNLKKELEK